eukprot:m.171727 g.171727  ORF g.171727 m.171727 type:complete len:422 (-) comp13412_c0_seq1:249-1514(-)
MTFGACRGGGHTLAGVLISLGVLGGGGVPAGARRSQSVAHDDVLLTSPPLSSTAPLNIPKHSISGFSAGASMASTHLVAFSNSVVGAGIVSGSPYGCNELHDPENTCSGWEKHAHKENTSIPWKEYIGDLEDFIHQQYKDGLIDDPKHLAKKKVFLFIGSKDDQVYPSVMHATADQFTRLKASVKSVFNIASPHVWVVDSTTCAHPGKTPTGSKCCGPKAKTSCAPHSAPPHPEGCCAACGNTGWRPPINNCQYDLAGQILQDIYGGNLKKRASQDSINGSFMIRFSQAKYIPKESNPKKALLDTDAYLFAPPACRKAGHTCKVHVHYHGCAMSYRDVSLAYMLDNGLAAYAVANNMVIVYPQSQGKGNPVGDACFDWLGHTGENFDTKQGVQLRTVMAILSDLPAILQSASGWSNDVRFG